MSPRSSQPALIDHAGTTIADAPASAALPGESTAMAPVRQSSGELELILKAAADPNMPVEKMERLLALHERILDRNAKAEFDADFAVMAAELPTVVERAETNNGTYATLEDIVEAVRPVLSKFGFALSHRTEWPEKGTVKIVGILTHRAGHSRETAFMSGADSSGNKNAIQGLGSAVAYGRRYTTKDLLNIVTRAEDDDGDATSKASAPVPNDYEKVRDALQEAAMKGTAALEAEWKKASQVMRAYIFSHQAAWWARAKAAAAKADGVARA